MDKEAGQGMKPSDGWGVEVTESFDTIPMTFGTGSQLLEWSTDQMRSILDAQEDAMRDGNMHLLCVLQMMLYESGEYRTKMVASGAAAYCRDMDEAGVEAFMILSSSQESKALEVVAEHLVDRGWSGEWIATQEVQGT